jgi:hypothetical protein
MLQTDLSQLSDVPRMLPFLSALAHRALAAVAQILHFV